MSDTHARILSAASYNAQLLQGLTETDSAASQLAQQSAYIADLDSQITTTSERLHELKLKTTRELSDHEKYRDSTFRRFAHKASGRKDRFSEKAAKEEKEYFDAIQAQKSADDELSYLKQLKAEADLQKSHFEAAAQRHQSLQAELDALYNSIFAGPTPEFPGEDQKEYNCTTISQQAQRLNHHLSREQHILFLLGQASSKLSEARNALDGAYGTSKYDMFGGGTMVSMQKRNYLERAESSIQQVRMLQSQYQQVAPELPNLGTLSIEIGSIWGDVVFDNIFSDMEMHDKIKVSIGQVDRAGAKCGKIIRGREQILGRLEGDVKKAHEELRRARIELQNVREEAFRGISGGTPVGMVPGAEAPPAYAV